MSLALSKSNISSYRGDIIPLHLGFDSGLHGRLARADIKWSCDSDCVKLRTFSGSDPMSFNNGVLLELTKVGSATVTATLDGTAYKCAVTVREPKKADSDDDFNFYIGDLHNHTTKIHDHDEFIARECDFQYELINRVKNEGLIDFCAISDHAAVLNDTDFFRTFTEVEKAEASGVVFFPGSEADITVIENDRFGIPRKNSGEIVTLNIDGYCEAEAWTPFYDCVSGVTDPVAIFAHPNVVGFSTKGVWDFCFNKNNTPEMLRAIRGIEVINGRLLHENLMHEFNYSRALDHGFRISPVASGDCHRPAWGYEATEAKTVILAKEKSREAFVDALRHNRFYATESGNVGLKYSVNGKNAPCDISDTSSYTFRVELSYFREDESTKPIECAVISNGGKTVKLLSVEQSTFEFTIESDTARYFYLRLADGIGRRTWSMPVWTGRAFDGYSEPNLTPIDLSGATAYDALNGCDAATSIDGDLFNTWTAESGKASVVIDLKERRSVCAVGFSPVIVVRPSRLKEPERHKTWRESDLTATIPTAYAVYTSEDGKNYEKKTEGINRIFGGESIITFDNTNARYVRFDILSTVGADAAPRTYGNAKCSIANLALFEPKK